MYRLSLALAFCAALPGQTTIQANLRGGSGSPKCTGEVVVDGVAEVTVRGQRGSIRTLDGQPARWVRLDCNQAMPTNPTGFRFRGIDGRGSQRLVSEPGGGRGAVVRIEDPKGGSEGYTFDLEWTGGSDFGGGRPGGGGGNGGGGWWGDIDGNSQQRAMQACRQGVRERIRSQYGVNGVNITRIDPDNNSGRRDWIVGDATGRQGGRQSSFSFSCSVNFNNGQVRRIDVRETGR